MIQLRTVVYPITCFVRSPLASRYILAAFCIYVCLRIQTYSMSVLDLPIHESDTQILSMTHLFLSAH